MARLVALTVLSGAVWLIGSGCGARPSPPPPTSAPAARDAPSPAGPSVPANTGALRVEVRTEPAMPRVGSTLVVHVDLTNQTRHEIGAVSLQLGGDWAGYPILEVRPSGSTVRSDATGQYVVSALRIPPGEKRVVDIVTIPQTPGESAFTFSVRELTDVGE